MWSLLVLFIGILSTVAIYETESTPLQDVDVATILKVLKENEHNKGHYDSHNIDSNPSDDVLDKEDDYSHYGSLKNPEIVELIKQAAQNKGVNDITSDYKETVYHKIHDAKSVDDGMNKLKPEAKDIVDKNTIQQILSYFQNQVKAKKKRRNQTLKNHKLVSNRISKITQGGHGLDRADLMDNYSKIYVIFNPLAIEKSRDQDSLSDLISKISSLSSESFHKQPTKGKKDQQYKGFSVKKGVLRRARRDYKDKYDPKDSMEDYKQKRARNDYGSGRTAIPYIRHRGDIYERDN